MAMASLQDPDGRELLQKAIGLHQTMRHAEAIEAYDAAITALRKEGELETEAQALNNVAILRIESGDAQNGLGNAEEALRFNNQILASKPAGSDTRAIRQRIARNLSNIGLAHESLGALDRALAAYEEALAQQRELGDEHGAVITLLNVCSLHWRRGDYAAALARHGEANAAMDGALARAAGAEEKLRAEEWVEKQRRVAAVNLGSIKEKLGQYREALEIYDRLLKEEEAGKKLDPFQRAYVHLNRGPLQRHLGAPQLALESYKTAALLFESIGDRAGRANAELNQGILQLENFGEAGLARDHFRAVLGDSGSPESANIEFRAYASAYLGRALQALGELDAAETILRETRDAAREKGYKEGEYIALFGLGRVVAARGDGDGALALQREAIGIVEGLRSNIDVGEDRLSFLFDRGQPYAAALAILASRPDSAADALEIAERERARSFLDRLGSGPSDSKPIAAEELARRLGATRSALVEYHFSDEVRLALVATGAGVRLVRLDADADVEPAIERVSESLRSPSGAPPAESDLAAIARAVLVPALAALEGDGSIDSLVFVPDGPLQAIPFEILPPDPARPGSPLLERYRVTYAPSASTLALFDAAAPSGPSSPLVGFGDPIAGAAHPTGPPLPALPASRPELEAAARLLGRSREKLFLGRENTLANFEREASLGARVLHVATHAIVDEFRPGASGLVFTPDGTGCAFLRADEIIRKSFPSDLTILAACRSLRGPDLPGEGVLGLARAFLLARSRSVVASLWDVDDAAAAATMEQFAYELSLGAPKSEALRRARLALRATPSMSHPRHWAAFTLWGDGDGVLAEAASSSIPLWAGIAGAALLFAFAILLSRSKPGGA